MEVAAPTCLRPNVRRPAKGTALSKSQQQDLHPKIPEVLKFQKQMGRCFLHCGMEKEWMFINIASKLPVFKT